MYNSPDSFVNWQTPESQIQILYGGALNRTEIKERAEKINSFLEKHGYIAEIKYFGFGVHRVPDGWRVYRTFKGRFVTLREILAGGPLLTINIGMTNIITDGTSKKAAEVAKKLKSFINEEFGIVMVIQNGFNGRTI